MPWAGEWRGVADGSEPGHRHFQAFAGQRQGRWVGILGLNLQPKSPWARPVVRRIPISRHVPKGVAINIAVIDKQSFVDGEPGCLVDEGDCPRQRVA